MDFNKNGEIIFKELPDNLPERILQFGEGNFLRAFCDWMLTRLLGNGLYDGKIVVVQPIPEGRVDILNEQDGLSTLILRGYRDGKAVEDVEIINSISRGLNAYTQWDEVLKCAESPLMEFIISNTTESGIVYRESDKLGDAPPASFPGKIAALLYHRYQHFAEKRGSGLVFLPCELSENNGSNLKRIVLLHAKKWNLPSDFMDWLEKDNLFLNTLVDRTVPGYPFDNAQNISDSLGYEDKLLNVAEMFHLWVIEGPEQLAARLPFDKAGLDVRWVKNLDAYRNQKVRILNGGHTSSVPAAFLAGLDTVEQMMNDPVTGVYIRDIIYKEIMTALDGGEQTERFANSVIERFANPLIKHYLKSILLNCSSKYKARVLPSLLDYIKKEGRFPQRLCFSFAAFIDLYRNVRLNGSSATLIRENTTIPFQDDLAPVTHITGLWDLYDGSKNACDRVVIGVLGYKELWETDLNEITGLAEIVSGYLWKIRNDGIRFVMGELNAERSEV